MGPQCPHCGAIYEWTCGELEEQVTAPKVYFCQDCRGLFILSPDEVEALQERFRPALEEANAPDPMEDVEALEPEPQDEPAPHRQGQITPRPTSAPHVELDGSLALREHVTIVAGPHEGLHGTVAVIDGDQVTLRIDGTNSCLRVRVDCIRRAA
jgi:predicted  nucleic acid-binding Zn-ribbon protein